MTIASTTNRNNYTGNGAVAAYSYTFKVFAETDLLVTIQNTSDVESTLTLTTDYTVSGVGETSGGTVTLVDASQAWLDGDGDLLSSFVITIRRVRPLTQTTDIRNQGEFFPETHEDALDHHTMIEQQQQDAIDRSIKLAETIDPADFDATLPAAIQGSVSTAIVTNASGNGLAVGPTITEISGANASAIAAAASASAASTSETNAEDWATKIDGIVESTDYSAKAYSIGGTGVTDTSGKGAAKEWATKAEDSTVDTSGYSALHHAAKAAASATLAANSAASVIWNDVIFLTSSDSPYTVTNSQRGAMLAIDCSSGAVTINLPSIAALDLTSPFVLGIKKTDSSGNSITVARDGTDTVNGATSLTIGVANAGSTFIPDTDTSPDEWTTADFGSSAGNITVDQFSGDGSTTAFTLSVSPGSENNTSVFITGIYQEKDEYSVSGTTLTFSAAPPTGTNNIEVMSGTTLSIGTPSDATVTTAKIADANVTKVKLADGANANKSVVSKTTTATLVVTDQIVLASTAGGAYSLTLPTAVGNSGLELFIKKTTSDASLLTIDGNASETIDGATTKPIFSQYDYIKIISDGSNWHIIDDGVKVRYQQLFLASNVTADTTDIASLKYEALVVGRLYRATLSVRMSSGANDNANVNNVHNSVDLNFLVMDSEGSSANNYAAEKSTIFIATATTITTRFDENVGSCTLLGDGSLGQSFMTIEDITDSHIVTTELD